jgi:hypothetical protein
VWIAQVLVMITHDRAEYLRRALGSVIKHQTQPGRRLGADHHLGISSTASTKGSDVAAH